MAAAAFWRQMAHSSSSPFPMATKLGIEGTEDSGAKNIDRNMGKINFLAEF